MNYPSRIPYEVHWFLCSEHEPPHEKNYHPSRSEQLLLTDGKQIFAGCFQIYDEDGVLEGPPEWIQHGRDGYQLDGITHWAFQPNLPDLKPQVCVPCDGGLIPDCKICGGTGFVFEGGADA